MDKNTVLKLLDNPSLRFNKNKIKDLDFSNPSKINYLHDLKFAILFGSWNPLNKYDCELIESITKKKFDVWFYSVLNSNRIFFDNVSFNITQKEQFFKECARFFFDRELNTFIQKVIESINENCNNDFPLILGMCKSLVYFEKFKNLFVHCSVDARYYRHEHAVEKILYCKTRKNINYLLEPLPLLCQASPHIFFKWVDYEIIGQLENKKTLSDQYSNDVIVHYIASALKNMCLDERWVGYAITLIGNLYKYDNFVLDILKNILELYEIASPIVQKRMSLAFHNLHLKKDIIVSPRCKIY